MDITVKKILCLQTKKQLYHLAQELNIQGRSSFNKNDLAEIVSVVLLKQETLISKILRLSEVQYQIFKEAMEKPVFLCDEENVREMKQIQLYGYVYISDNVLTVCEDVKNNYQNLKIQELDSEHSKIIWLCKCMKFGMDIYGMMPDSILVKLFNSQRKYNLSKQDVIDLYIKYQDLFAYCSYGADIFIPSRTSFTELRTLLNRKKEQRYYIPGRQEIEDYSKNCFLFGNRSYQQMLRFVIDDMKLSDCDAGKLLYDLWKVYTSGGELEDEFREILLKYYFPSANSAITFIRYALDIYNNTRLREYRGYTPAEMKHILKNTNGTIALFDRNEEISFIKLMTPVLEQKGFYIGEIQDPIRQTAKDENINIKIYPNDPCPCGSGLKYKKCCGKY